MFFSKKAPELQGIAGFINADDIKLEHLKGKVVMVDFWDYSCINCIRTQPFLNEWYEKYRKFGFEMIGVHTPEFEFEKDIVKVREAVKRFGIKYPVALDNDYRTWNAYSNSYWPRKYLIDVRGVIRFDHIGEGGYEETEKWIQKLLEEAGAKVSFPLVKEKSKVDFQKIKSPELYFGHNFIRKPIGNIEGYEADAEIDYLLPEKIEPNTAYFEGKWRMRSDHMELLSDEGKIALVFDAASANLVAGAKKSSLEPVVDLKKQKKVLVDGFRMYNLFSDDYKIHSMEIRIKGKGLQVFTFTFG